MTDGLLKMRIEYLLSFLLALFLTALVGVVLVKGSARILGSIYLNSGGTESTEVEKIVEVEYHEE